MTEGKKKQTHLLLGTPNASAAALLHTDGNVECALHLVLDGHHHLGMLCDTLVMVQWKQVTFRPLSCATLAPSPARWITDAVYDARERCARVTWLPGAPQLVLAYPTTIKRVLFDGVPSDTSIFEDFDIQSTCCELEVIDPVARLSARVPLRIEHALDLPVDGITSELDLQELLLLHSGRYTPAGIAARRAAGSGGGDGSSGTAAVFGAMLTPREVFRALLSIGVELASAPSLGAFQAQLLGPWGVRRLAERIAGPWPALQPACPPDADLQLRSAGRPHAGRAASGDPFRATRRGRRCSPSATEGETCAPHPAGIDPALRRRDRDREHLAQPKQEHRPRHRAEWRVVSDLADLGLERVARRRRDRGWCGLPDDVGQGADGRVVVHKVESGPSGSTASPRDRALACCSALPLPRPG